MFENKYDGTDEQIDSRDIIEKIEELTDEFIAATEDGVEPDEWIDPRDCQMSADDWKLGLSDDDAELLAALIKFREEEDGNYDDSFADGVFFIHADDFTDAMKEMCEDVGYLPKDTPDWLVIDWEKTSDNLRADYRESNLRGGEYWAR